LCIYSYEKKVDSGVSERRGEDSVTTEAEIGVTRHGHMPPEARRKGRRDFPKAFRRSVAMPTV
jgi:hypothetical protein